MNTSSPSRPPSPETLPFRTRLRLRLLRHRKPVIVGLVCLVWFCVLSALMPGFIALIEQNPAAAGWVVGFFALAAVMLAWSLAE